MNYKFYTKIMTNPLGMLQRSAVPHSFKTSTAIDEILRRFVCLFVLLFWPRVPAPLGLLGVVIATRCPFPVKLHVVGTLVKTVALGFEYKYSYTHANLFSRWLGVWLPLWVGDSRPQFPITQMKVRHYHSRCGPIFPQAMWGTGTGRLMNRGVR